MINEVAVLTIDPNKAAEFESAVASVAIVFREAEGCHGMWLEREIENPACYLLIVQWTSVEAHMEQFRTSSGFQRWRSAVSAFFTIAPSVTHTEKVMVYF